MKIIFHHCLVCGEPIRVGDKAFEIGYKEKDKDLICEKCHGSIEEHDTEEGEDGDGNG